jgi:hypothetical protein
MDSFQVCGAAGYDWSAIAALSGLWAPAVILYVIRRNRPLPPATSRLLGAVEWTFGAVAAAVSSLSFGVRGHSW